MLKYLVYTLVLSSLSCAMSVSMLQTISPEKLGCIQGLGDKRLQAIVQYRKQHQLKSLEELLTIKGIGQATLKNIREYKTKKRCKTLNKKEDTSLNPNEYKRKAISAK